MTSRLTEIINYDQIFFSTALERLYSQSRFNDSWHVSCDRSELSTVSSVAQLLIYMVVARETFSCYTVPVIYNRAFRTIRLLCLLYFLSFSLSFFLISLITVAYCNSQYHYREVFYYCTTDTSVTSLGLIVSYFYAKLVDLISLSKKCRYWLRRSSQLWFTCRSLLPENFFVLF